MKLSIDKKDTAIKEYIRLLELAKREYQKVTQENKHLRHQLLIAKKNYQDNRRIKRKYIVEQPEPEPSSEDEATLDVENQIIEDKYPEIEIKKQKIDKKKGTIKPLKKNKNCLNILTQNK